MVLQEGGLLGSQEVFANYASTGKTILGFVCQGMFYSFPRLGFAPFVEMC